MRRFLGVTGFYRRFERNYSQRARPLYNIANGTGIFEWDKESQRAMDNLKPALAAVVTLAHPDFITPFHLQTDGSKDSNHGRKEIFRM